MNALLLESLVQSFADCLTVESAKKIISLRAPTSIQERADELADKANRGLMSADEQLEYDSYLASVHFVTLLQARARRLL